MNRIEEGEELRRRTLFLWRKAKNGNCGHFRQVWNVLGPFSLPEYNNLSGPFPSDTGWYHRYITYEAALLHTIAEKVFPPDYEWEVCETMNEHIDLVITNNGGNYD